MATKMKSTFSTVDVSPTYEDFEPFCEWKRGEDMLIVHVPGFKKEHLRVQVNTSGVLKISGERPLIGDKSATKSRFYKETRVPVECNINDVQSKLSDGKLTITMPRITPNSFNPNSASLDNSTQPPPRVRDAPRQEQRVSMQGKFEPAEETIGFGSLKVAKKMAMNVGIAVVAIATLGVIVFLKPETPVSASSATEE